MLKQQDGRGRRPWSSALLLGMSVVLAVAGVLLLLPARVPDDPVRTARPVAAAVGSGRDTADAGARSSPLGRAEPVPDHPPRAVSSGPPVRVRVQAIGVDARVVPLGLDPAGHLKVPDDFSAAGWWQGGAEAGEAGPTVVVGHVDSYQGPAVFYRLPDLELGDEVILTVDGGESLSYRVTGIQQVPKNDFPTAAVYSHTPGPTLRLITCGGPFDRTTRHYRDNTIVFADLS